MLAVSHVEVKQRRRGQCYVQLRRAGAVRGTEFCFPPPVVVVVATRSLTMSGQASGRSEQDTGSDAGASPSPVVRLDELQGVLQAMVEKAVSDCRTQRTPDADNSGEGCGVHAHGGRFQRMVASLRGARPRDDPGRPRVGPQ